MGTEKVSQTRLGQRNFASEFHRQGRTPSAPPLTPKNWSEIYSLYGVSDLSDLMLNRCLGGNLCIEAECMQLRVSSRFNGVHGKVGNPYS